MASQEYTLAQFLATGLPDDGLVLEDLYDGYITLIHLQNQRASTGYAVTPEGVLVEQLISNGSES